MGTRSVLVFLIAAATAFPQCWQRLWHDEFNGTAIHPGKWTFETGGGGWGNQELENYTARPENAHVENGHLLITARKESYQGSNYTSARMKTAQKGYWRYGRIEARIKLPSDKGMWPAFWMMPEDSVYGGWPHSGEIDIVEVVGTFPKRAYATIHTVDSKGNHVGIGDFTDLASGVFSDDFHVLSVEWDDSSMRFALDGTVYATRLKPLPNGAFWPFDQPFYIILNLAVGGQWPGPPDSSTPFPQVMDVDWVRVSQKLDDIQMTGPDLVVPGSKQGHYALPNIEGATYQWTVPDGASILSGAGTHRIKIDWGAAVSGSVTGAIQTDCGTSTKALAVTVSENLWRNGSFTDNFTGWHTNGNAKFEIISDDEDVDGKAARVTVSKTGVNPWDVQLSQPNVKLVAGNSYTVTFWARSAQNHTIPMSFIDSTTYMTFSGKSIDLTPDWTQYSLTFTQPVTATALFNLDLARETGVYDFDGFSFVKN